MNIGASAGKEKKKIKVAMPGAMETMVIIMLVACLLTYLIPAGAFEYNEAGMAISGTYHRIDQTPVNPIKALMLVVQGGMGLSLTVITFLLIGGLLGGIFQLDSLKNVINWSVSKFKHSGVTALVGGMFILMAVIGFFLGGDFIIALVPLGLILTKRLKLDPIVALSITFLPLFLGIAAGPSALRTGQIIIGIPAYSGYNLRLIQYIIFAVVTLLYVISYAKRVAKDPSRSFMSDDKWLREIEEDSENLEIKDVKLTWQDASIFAMMIVPSVIIAYGNSNLGWAKNSSFGGMEYLVMSFIVSLIYSYAVKGKTPKDMVAGFTKGLQGIVAIAVIIIFAGTVSVILKEGNILSTIINWVVEPLMNASKGAATIAIFFFNSAFNFFVPSGSALMGVMVPIMSPVGDMIGLTPQVLISAIGFGAGLSNLIVPTLGATVASVEMCKAKFTDWLKFMIPLFLIWCILACGCLYYIASINWIGF